LRAHSRRHRSCKVEMKMTKSNKITLLCLILLATVVAHSVAALRGQIKDAGKRVQKGVPSQDRAGPNFKSQFPVVDLESPEPPDNGEREKRKSKGKRYDNYGLVEQEPSDTIDETVRENHWQDRVEALPVGQSAAVVVGEVVRASAHLSNDKSGVYTEFIIRVSEVLKGGGANGITADQTISADRPGGMVKYPNGHKILYRLFGMNMPRPARRYVLFLGAPQDSPNYRIVTGYELTDEGVIPLDIAPHFDAYKGLDETTFLKTVREAI
jgi:hypothetical protein